MASPAKFGVSALKIGKRLGKLNAKLLGDLTHLATKAIDFGALRQVAGRAGRLDWDGATLAATKIVDSKVVAQLTTGGTALGSLAKARGPKATLDSLNVAESTKDLTTLGKLSERSGGTYRGVLKMSGGKILGPIKKVNRMRKIAKRGDMALSLMASLLGWMLSGLLWAVSFIWTAVKMGWRVTRFMLRSPVTPASSLN